ncbi:MAG: metal ABC transporter ATP-binding protein [Miltoncostaeaceae bacterium]
MADPILKIEGLEVAVDDKPILKGVDLEVPQGEVHALMGPNGSGKSTLLRTIAGLIPPVAGTLQVQGCDPGARGVGVSYLSQSHEQGFLLPIRARDVVRMGRWPARGLTGRLRADDDALVDGAMHAMGIHDLADMPLGMLSGGQCQRVHLAQAVCRDAGLLLLDEPTAGLDAASRERYLFLMDAQRARGAAIVTATHDVREARRADLVLIVAERVVACGAPDEALTPASLADAFGVVIEDGGATVIDPHHGHEHHHGPGAPHVRGHAPGHDHGPGGHDHSHGH